MWASPLRSSANRVESSGASRDHDEAAWFEFIRAEVLIKTLDLTDRQSAQMECATLLTAQDRTGDYLGFQFAVKNVGTKRRTYFEMYLVLLVTKFSDLPAIGAK